MWRGNYFLQGWRPEALRVEAYKSIMQEKFIKWMILTWWWYRWRHSQAIIFRPSVLVFRRWSLDGGSGVAVLGGRSGSDSQPFTRTELCSFIFTLPRALYRSPRPNCVLSYAPMCCFGVYCLRSSPPLPQPFQNSDGPCLYFVSVTFLQGKPFRR